MQDSFTRREWLALLAKTAAGGALASSGFFSLENPVLADGPSEWIIGPYRDSQAKDPLKQYYLAYCELHSKKSGKISVPFRGHATLRHPTRPRTVLLISKQGSQSAEISLKDGKITSLINSTPGIDFYGHGAFSGDGSHLFTTEIEQKTGRGFLKIRDAKSYAVLGEFESHGFQPHDCMFVDDGKTVIVANNGHPRVRANSPSDQKTSVAFLEAKSGKLLHKLRAPGSGVGYQLSHVALTPERTLLVSTFPQTADGLTVYGAVLAADDGGELQVLELPEGIRKRLIDQSLSMAIDESRNILAVTGVNSNLTLFWNCKNKQFLSAVESKAPHGVVLTDDKRYFLISGGVGSLIWVRTSDLQIDPAPGRAYFTSNFSHLYRMDLGKA